MHGEPAYTYLHIHKQICECMDSVNTTLYSKKRVNRKSARLTHNSRARAFTHIYIYIYVCIRRREDPRETHMHTRPQRDPRVAQGWPQGSPRETQGGPKYARKTPQGAQETPGRPRGDQGDPGDPRVAPEWPQGCPASPNGRPKGTQDAPVRPQGASREGPGDPKR